MGFLTKGTKNVLLIASRQPPCTNSGMAWFGQKIKKIYFCYLIRVEHEKCFEMCAWIVRFGQNLRNWDYF
jgi:hypothetical protein